MKYFCAAFICLQFGYVIFGRKDLGAKAAHKMLVKLTPGGRRWHLIFPHEFSLLQNPESHSQKILLEISCFLLASKTLLAQSFMQGGNTENLRVIQVEVIAPEKLLDVNTCSKNNPNVDFTN